MAYWEGTRELQVTIPSYYRKLLELLEGSYGSSNCTLFHDLFGMINSFNFLCRVVLSWIIPNVQHGIVLSLLFTLEKLSILIRFMLVYGFCIFLAEDYQTLRDLLLELSLPERSCSIKYWKQSGEVCWYCNYTCYWNNSKNNQFLWIFIFHTWWLDTI